MASLAASEEPITGGAPAEEQDDDDDEDEDDDDDDDDEDDEDPRIEKLRSYSEKHSVEETVELLVSKIGGGDFKPIVIGETMCFSANSVMAYILSEAVLELGSGKLSEQLKAKAKYFKLLCKEDTELQLSVMCCLERWLVETEDIKDLHHTWNQLYSAEIVSEDSTFERWFETPNLSIAFGIGDEERENSREACKPFMSWLATADEDEDDEEIDVGY